MRVSLTTRNGSFRPPARAFKRVPSGRTIPPERHTKGEGSRCGVLSNGEALMGHKDTSGLDGTAARYSKP